MHVRTTLAIIAAAGLALVPGALAKPPTKPPPKPPKPPNGASAVTLDAAPGVLVFTQVATLSGRLTGPSPAGTNVRLEEDTVPPLGDHFTATGKSTGTAPNGGYTFTVAPAVNTLYRVVAKSAPDVTSPVRLVRVRPLVGLTLSDPTPRRGTLVTFSGSVRPAHDGAAVRVQRRTATGRWAAVASTTLKDAGTTRSTYSRRVRVRSNGVYRVVLPTHGDNITGISRARTIVVH